MDLKRGPQFAATRIGLAQHGDRARVDAETITYSTALRAGETARVATRSELHQLQCGIQCVQVDQWGNSRGLDQYAQQLSLSKAYAVCRADWR